MKIYRLAAIVLLFTALIGCSEQDQYKTALVEGSFSVADSIDSSNNFSGIGLTIIKRDSANADADTLFHESTDSTGSFRGVARFRDKRQYTALISRNDRNLARFGLILADGDTVKISGELPDLENTIEVQSREHNAMEVFRRINRGFQRVATYVQAGRLTGDSLRNELDKWSDLYWEVYNEHEGTLASRMAASESVRLLQGWNNEGMMNRIRSVQDKESLVSLGATYGKNYLAENKGLEYTLKYLDTLQSNTQTEESEMRVRMERIKLLYDSAKVDRAKQLLQDFKKKYDNKNANTWAEAISYDLNYLSPGDTIPSFSFQVNGNTISRDSLLGSPYILEITTLANRLYQEQFDRTVAIHSLYKNFGLQVVTIPLDNSQVTVDAFFEARGIKPWPVAPAQAFERQELLELFNIRVIPTRFLINREGKIVRKYVGREYTDVIQGIQTIIKQDKKPS